MSTSAEELLLKIAGDTSGGQEAVQKLADAMTNGLAKALKTVNDSGAETKTRGLELQKVLDDLVPSTKNAGASFTDLKGTLSEMWEHPTSAVKELGLALATDLSTGAGAVLVPIGAVAAALVVATGAAYHLAEQAAAIGGELHDMSEKTGIGVPALSALGSAAQIAGSSLDQVSNAMFMFQRNMGEGSDKFVEGLGRIQISMADLKTLAPDQQFMAIAEGIRSTVDPSERAAATMEIFGKQGRNLLPLLMKPLGELVEQSKELGLVWSETDAKAAEELEMQTRALHLTFQQFSVDVGKVMIPLFTEPLKFAKGSLGWFLTSPISPFRQIIDDLRDQETAVKIMFAADSYGPTARNNDPRGNGTFAADGAFQLGAAAMAAQGVAAGALDQHLAHLRETVLPLNEAQRDMARALLAGGDSAKDVAQWLGVTEKSVKDYEQATKKAAEETKKHAAEALRLAGELLKVEGSLTAIPESLQKIGRSYDESKLGKLVDELGKVEANAHLANFGFAGMVDSLERVGTQSKVTMKDVEGWEFVGPELDILIDKVDVLGDTFAHIPQVVQQAFTGGGGLAGAAQGIGSVFGTDLGTNIKGALTKSLTEDSSKALGPMTKDLLNAIPAIGSLIGPALSMLFKIGGPSQQELQGRDVEAQFQNQFGSFQQMIDAVGKAYEATGRGAQQAQLDVKALMDAEKQGGAATKAAIDVINLAFADQKKHTADVAAAVTDVTKAAQMFGGAAPEQFRAAITELVNMKGVTEDEKAALLALTKDVEPNFAQLEGTASKYGITLEGLGPQFEQAHIEKTAKGIFDDFTALTKAGGDVGGVLTGMSKDINQLVSDSRKFGTAIPENMKPLIQNLIDAGKLTDDQGGKLTTVSGIKFEGTPLDVGLNTLNTTIQKLVDLLSGDKNSVTKAITDVAAAAATKIPKNPFADWQVPDLQFPDFSGVAWGGAQECGAVDRTTFPTLRPSFSSAPSEFVSRRASPR